MPSISDLLRKRSGRALFLGFITFLILAPLSFHRLGQTVENAALDLFYAWRGAQPLPPDLLVVGIDEPSFQELRQPWPWPRRLHAALVRQLAAAGARAIVFDVIFADPSSAKDDAEFAEAMSQAGNVILGEDLEMVTDPRFSREIMIQPCKSFRRAARDLGLVKITPDLDGVVRHFQLDYGGKKTLAAATVNSSDPELSFPPNLSGLINYAGPPRSLDTVSYYQVIDPVHPLPTNRIRGRIVLVGRTLDASPSPQARSDTFSTPFFSQTGQVSSGVEIHGHIIHTLLTGRWGAEFSPVFRLGLALGAMVLGAFGLAWLSPLAGLGVMLAMAVTIFGLSAALFLWGNIWLPPVLLVLGIGVIYSGNTLVNHLIEAREKRWLRQAFSRYLSPAVVEVIVAHPEKLRLGGEMVEGTVLFTDLAAFTGISENMDPTDLISLLNDYFSPLTEIIMAHQGTVDKFIGDAIMAFWGAPLPAPDHAEKACQAALEMQAAILHLQNQWRDKGFPPLKTRMGIHSGSLIVGNVGSRDRFNYTVLGDTVNLASRLEGVNRIYGTSTILSDSCYHQVEGKFSARELDLVRVKGREHPVSIYELLGPPGDEIPEWLRIFHEGRKAYLKQDWDRAENSFQEVLHRQPDDPPSLLYLARIQQYRRQPPPLDWQGVFSMDSK